MGANEVERARLVFQQEVWGSVTERFLDRLGVREGWRCLDVGAGPGLVTERLRERVGARGRVDALEPSSVWREDLERLAARAQGVVRVIPARIEDAVIEDGAYDLVFARWVLSFLPNAGAVVSRLARALAPGGCLAVQDYNHESISLFPESDGFRAVVRATRALYAKDGGDIWVAARLPAHFRAAGLSLADYTPTVLCGGPDSMPFCWADSFFPVHSENMVRAGVLTDAERDRFLREWAERKANPASVFFTPIVVDAAGRRG